MWKYRKRNNQFKKLERYFDHRGRVSQFELGYPVLEPDRIINRALYGTDYDPQEVGFAMNRVMSKAAEHLLYRDKEVVARAIEDGVLGGWGMLSHEIDEDGDIKLVYKPPQECMQKPVPYSFRRERPVF